MSRWTRCCAALLLLVSAHLSAEVRSLTILHTNDLHARLSPLVDHHGGFAYVAAVIRRERAGCTDCILLNAGDIVQGSPVSTIFHGVPSYEISNLFGFDVSTLGNHEFDWGWQQTRKLLEIAKFPTVTANIVDDSGHLITGEPYRIVRVNRLRVAVIGIMTGDFHFLTTPKLRGQWHTLPPVETARKYAAELKAKSDLIVVLAHITPTEEREFLSSAPEVPVVVSGHIHTGMQEPLTHDGRIVVRVKGYGEEVGRLELQVDTDKKVPVSWKWKRIPVDPATIEPAPDVAREVKHWEAEVSARVDKPLAISKHAFTRPEVRKLIEQAMRDETGADFAFMNYGGVRDVLPEGQLLVRNIWDIMPFDNRVLVGTFKGSQLPPVVVGDRKIDPDREYTLAVSDFTAANQSAREELGTTGLEFPRDAGVMRDMLIGWFRKKKVIE